MWYECQECNFCTNSPRKAAAHVETTGHLITQEIDWTDE